MKCNQYELLKPAQGHYVYVLMDPRKPVNINIDEYNIKFHHEPFYVGKGTGKRYANHFLESTLKRYSKSWKYCTIRKLLRLELKIPIEIIYCNGVDKAFDTEINLIKILGRKDLNKGILLNKTDGGQGWQNVVMTDKMRENFSKGQKGKKLGINNPMATKVYQYKLTGEFVREFTTIKEALASVNKSDKKAGLALALTGKIKTLYNYQWFYEYKGAEVLGVRKGPDRIWGKGKPGTYSKKVCKINKEDDTVIKVYNSVKEASNDTGIKHGTISNCARELATRTRKVNYYWRYAKDVNI